ncbi:MAG: hypothetical protein FIA99_10885 [Ruminiclostridium sp.]|nr:hypothetical protein [Ruminiclostridium sp.]
MVGRITDHRNVNLEELNRDVIRGKSNGKIIWQPRIGCWHQDRVFRKEELPAPYEGMDLPGLYKKLGCSARIYDYLHCIRKIDDPKVKRYSRAISENEVEHVLETPAGKINSIILTTESSWHYIIKKWWVTSEEDMKVAMWAEERCTWEWVDGMFDKVHSEWGDLGMPAMMFPRVNVEHLYLDMMGVEAAIYAITDYRDTVEKYFKILDESHERLIEVVNKSPFEFVNFGDNLHCGTLSPDLFKKYVLPSYQKRNELLHKAGKFTNSHWDGDTKSLLPFAKETGLDGIEAITPKPQGDVTLEEVKKALGDDIFLIDGIAAILFDELYTVEELKEQASKVIELFAPKLILGISDEMSSTGDIERVKLVGEIVDEYNSKRGVPFYG